MAVQRQKPVVGLAATVKLEEAAAEVLLLEPAVAGCSWGRQQQSQQGR